MIKPMIGCVLAYNLNAKEQLEFIRGDLKKSTHWFANKTHYFWFSVLTGKWYNRPTYNDIAVFNELYSIDNRRYNWLKEQVK